MLIPASAYHRMLPSHSFPSKDSQPKPVLLNNGQDFDLPAMLRVPLHQLKFIDPDELEVPDTELKYRHQPLGGQLPLGNTAFQKNFRRQEAVAPDQASLSAEAAPLNPKLKPKLNPKLNPKRKMGSPKILAQYRQQIALALEKRNALMKTKNSRYPDVVKKLFRQAVQENPTLLTKQVADALGLPASRTYYWLKKKSGK